MDPASFIELVENGDGPAVVAALGRSPALAAARDKNGVSVVCLAVYRGRLELAALLAAARSDLDIFEASCLGKTARVREVLSEKPADVQAVSPDGFSPLGYSAFFGHMELLLELIQGGADVDAPSRNGMAVCPINSAAAHSDPEKAVALVAALLDAGAAPNSRQHGGYTALHEAALNGNLDMIELLLAHGADPAPANDQGTTPLDLARQKGREQAARMLMERAH